MSQDRTYTLIEFSFHGRELNTIKGLTSQRAEIVADVLRRGDAYTGEEPRQCYIVPEQNEAERLQQCAEAWLSPGSKRHTLLHSGAELAAALDLLANGLVSLGSRHLGDIWMTVDIQVAGMSNDDEETRRAAVDLLAQVAGTKPEEQQHGIYAFRGEQFRAFTPIAKPKPEPEPAVASPDVFAEDLDPAPAVAEHKHFAAWKEDDGSHGRCGVECACGTTYDGFDSLAEATEALDRHIAAEAKRIPAERVDELLAELNKLTSNGDNWWDWIADLPEFDREATHAATDSGELHLVDGTVLSWDTSPSAWKRAEVAA